MQNNKVKNVSECNLLHDIINPPQRAQHLNNHYSPILHGCMNNGKVKQSLKNLHYIGQWMQFHDCNGKASEKINPRKRCSDAVEYTGQKYCY